MAGKQHRNERQVLTTIAPNDFQRTSPKWAHLQQDNRQTKHGNGEYHAAAAFTSHTAQGLENRQDQLCVTIMIQPSLGYFFDTHDGTTGSCPAF